MDELLTVFSTRRIPHDNEQLTLTENTGQAQITETPSEVSLETSRDVIRALQSKPSFETLQLCLQWLSRAPNGFNVKIPGPQATQIISALVNEIAPNFWHLLKEENGRKYSNELKLLVRSLSSIAGIGALCARLRTWIAAGKQEETSKQKLPKSQVQSELRDALEVLHLVLRGKNTLRDLWQEVRNGSMKAIQRHLLGKELVSLVSSGKILSIAAETLEYCELSRHERDELSWLGEGKMFASWLGENARQLFKDTEEDNEDAQRAATSILVKALSLGYSDHIVAVAFPGMLLGKEHAFSLDLRLFGSLSLLEKTRILSIILRILSNKLTTSPPPCHDRLVRGIAFIIGQLVHQDASISSFLEDWLTSTASDSTGAEIGVRRAVMTIVFDQPASLRSASPASAEEPKLNNGEKVVKQLLNQFADKLAIQHSPILRQEVCAQNLLLSIGWLHRLKKFRVETLAKSSLHLNAVSNRLAASSERARFLGMVYAMAVSGLVDPIDKRIDFGIDAVNPSEGRWYRDLVHVEDSVGSIRDLILSEAAELPVHTSTSTKRPPKNAEPSRSNKIVEVVEVLEEAETESESSGDDLTVYAKPDSDQEDEDEDPTLIQRNKPTAPVYIRDLIVGLRDTENYDRHKLAITTAASLIRRKSNFGSEVTEHIEQLASQITGLKDQYDLEKFQDMRIQAMIALVVAQPVKMGQWFSNMLFSGDYSMSQRASMLTALTLAARELAGYREEDAELTGAYVANEQLFPSKKMPDKYERMYKIEATPVNALSQQLERTMIKPMAAEAADKMAGPKVLQVRTFSSRMEVEKKRKRPIANELAKTVADGFFYPLTGRWRSNMQVYGDSSIFKSPFLQAHFLKTLALILSASGTNTLSLPAMTVEFWALLLSVRAAALNAKPVLEALLFSFLTLLDLNGNDQRRIAEDHSRELLETQAWVQQIMENLATGAQEDEKIRVLAAGVLVRAQEVVDKYQRLLLGELVDFK